jgi:hypothetical protein
LPIVQLASSLKLDSASGPLTGWVWHFNTLSNMKYPEKRVSVVVKALYCKPEDRAFDAR